MFLEARRVRAKPPGLAPLESPIPLQLSRGNRIRQQRGTLDLLGPCGPLRSQASLLNERRSTIFTFRSSYNDHAPQRGGVKEHPLRTAGVPRFGAHWLRWLGAGGSVLLLSLLTLVGVTPALALAGQVSEFLIPAFKGNRVSVNRMTLGSDGNVWFTANTFVGRGTISNGFIGRVTTAGVITEFGTPTAVSDPQDIALGSDGNIWFNEDSAHAVGRILTH